MHDLFSLIVCPACKTKLRRGTELLVCGICDESYPIYKGIPVLFDKRSVFSSAQGIRTKISQTPAPLPKQRLPSRLLSRWYSLTVPLTTWINDDLFEELNQCASEMIIVNLGSGLGLFDKKINPHVRLINLDVEFSDRAHLLADAHFLPFADESVDGIFSNAVLEHVQRPWIVAEEIFRVLKPGGRVFINVPFLNIIHDDHDYFRFTDKGLDILFDRFRKVKSGVSAGPSSFLGPFMIEYLLYFVPNRFLRGAMRPLLRLSFWPLKYLDLLIRSNCDMRLAADAFYFVGVKMCQA